MSLLGTTGQGNSSWSGSRLLICSAQTALPFPPDDADCGFVGAISDGARSAAGWAEDEFALQIVSAGSTNLTAAALYAIRLEPDTVADATVTTTHASETLNWTTHGQVSGLGPLQLSNSGGALPAGYVAFAGTGTGLYYFGKTGASTGKLYTSRIGALTASTADLVSITGDGTGTHTISDISDEGPYKTHRVVYAKVADLGDDVAGTLTVTLTAHQAYLDGPFVHQPGTIGYCVAATFSAAVAVTASAYPRKKVQR